MLQAMEGFMEHFDAISDDSIKQFLVSFAEKELQPDLSVRKAADRIALQVLANHRRVLPLLSQARRRNMRHRTPPGRNVCSSPIHSGAGIASAKLPTKRSLTPRPMHARSRGDI